VEIAEDSIAAAIRLITTERGHDPRTHVLVAGGGAGPLHATGVADRLGVTRVVVPRSAGVLATIGLLRTDLRHELVRTEVIDLGPDAGHRIRPILRDLARGARAWFASEAIPTSQQRLRWTVSMRYADQASELHVPWERPARAGRASIETLLAAFHERHRERFGYDMPASVVECVTIRAEATAERPRPRLRHAASRRRHRTRHPSRPVFVDRRLGFRPARILGLDDVRAAGVDGPVVIEPPDSTVWIPPHWQARRLASGDLLLQLIGSP
jgi:N-methylhydantoinase A/oxoprolinase/acetone carboxylase beta subunit